MTPCALKRLRYNSTHVQKKHIGCESPAQFAAKSRNRTVCGFFVGTSYGGADGRAQALPVSLRELPGLSHLSALPPYVRVGRQSFNATLEAIMAKTTSSASAQITKSLREIDGDISSVTDTISAISWMAQLAIEHTAQIGTTAGVARHFKAIFELIQCQAEMLGNDMDCKVSELCESLAGEAA